jgi:hypothetical protein
MFSAPPPPQLTYIIKMNRPQLSKGDDRDRTSQYEVVYVRGVYVKLLAYLISPLEGEWSTLRSAGFTQEEEPLGTQR